MDEHLQFKAALSLAKRTLEFVGDYRTPPTPHVYELFYTFAAGLNPELSSALGNVIAVNDRLPVADAEALYQKYLAPEADTQQVEEIAKKLSEEVAANLKLLGSAAVSTKQYEQSLDSAEKQLGDDCETPEAKTTLHTLIAATREMAQANAELVSNLEASRAQVEEMEECLKLVREESSKDALTGLTNRKRFDLRLNEEILAVTQTQKPLCLLVLDIDHFKNFNDRHGHLAGDAVLRFVSSCIQSNIKGRDVAARF
ncbi:MAG: diguanylate cyclase, partial [Hyphomicrobiales bacterium]|nr:diguanylate cyclase [Hyphomicrobiales bacterium]